MMIVLVVVMMMMLMMHICQGVGHDVLVIISESLPTLQGSFTKEMFLGKSHIYDRYMRFTT